MKKAFIATGVILLFLVVINIQSFAEENVINGCVRKKDGKLRIVSDCAKCRRWENCISWNMQGPQGEPGPQGEQGQKGDKGDTGEKGDTGLAGIDGLHCWDSNGNYECDLQDEDKNDDEVCNALDCQGASVIGAIKVYDSSDPPQYLGILLGSRGYPMGLEHQTEIFIPDPINKSAVINGYTGEIAYEALLFDGPQCTGTPYVRYDNLIIYCSIQQKYYVGVGLVSTIPVISYGCSNPCLPTNSDRVVFQAVEFAEEDIPFTLPVTLPLQFAYNE